MKLESDARVADLAAAQALTQAPSIEKTPPSTGRVMVYTGLIQLVVANIAQTLDEVQRQALSSGGYLQERDATSIVIRVPAARFSELVSKVVRLGEVVHQQIKAQDLTDEMRDLRIRLDNALQTRQRLLAILEKSAKVEDTLKIEAELQRVTEMIELLKGKLQLLESQVAYSLLKVQVNSPLPQKQLVAQIPFDWIRHLGEGVTSGLASQQAISSSRDRREIRFDVPKGFIRYFDRDEMTEAMSAAGVLIKIQKHDNYRGGELDFWAALVKRALVEGRSVTFTHDQAMTLPGNILTRLMIGTRDLAGQPQGYLIAVVAIEKTVYAYEAWGPIKEFELNRPAIETSIRSLDVRRL